jgi:hypothetical protein
MCAQLVQILSTSAYGAKRRDEKDCMFWYSVNSTFELDFWDLFLILSEYVERLLAGLGRVKKTLSDAMMRGLVGRLRI